MSSNKSLSVLGLTEELCKSGPITAENDYGQRWVSGGSLKIWPTDHEKGGDRICGNMGSGWKYLPRFKKRVPKRGTDYRRNEQGWKGPGGKWKATLDARCVLTQATADPKECCVTGKSSDPNKVCNPCYGSGISGGRYKAPLCSTHWQKHCTAKNMGTVECRLWAEQNSGSTTAKGRVREHCSDNMDDPWCQNWKSVDKALYNNSMMAYCSKGDRLDGSMCRTFAKANPGQMDVAVQGYCKGKPNTPKYNICSCINSPVVSLQSKYGAGETNPKCIDGECINSGYQTKGVLDTACPPEVNCNVIFDMTNTSAGKEIVLSDVAANQKCSGEFNSSVSEKTIIKDSSQVSEKGLSPHISDSNRRVYRPGSPTSYKNIERDFGDPDESGLAWYFIVLIVLAVLIGIFLSVLGGRLIYLQMRKRSRINDKMDKGEHIEPID